MPLLAFLRSTPAATEAPGTAADAFVADFTRAYGADHPRFLRRSYREALQQAQQESKFLFTYLHSGLHESTPAFCADVLCSPAVVAFLNANVLCWGGDIRHSEAYQLSGALQHSTFPHVALLVLGEGSRPTLLGSLEGAITAELLLQLLLQTGESHGALLAAARATAAERDYTRSLRAQQDAEYEASLAADRERMQALAAAQQAAEQEAAARAAAEAATAAEAAAQEAAEQTRLAALEKSRQEKAAALPSEPPAGTGVTQLVLRLRDGGRLQRRFADQSRVEEVYDFAEASGVMPPFVLVMAFPRTVYPRDARTLAEAGLVGGAMLLVEAED